jgi:murein DD-endopeptidase MepM/ murein hydrolase activator NlpD
VARLVNPWPEGRTINARSPYGYRVHPITGKRTFHHGVDVAGVFPVTAAADGVVQHIGWNATGGGNTVLINHGDIVTVYYHGRERTKLKVGQQVKAGQFIYTSGSTGSSTGAHLHFEVRRPGGRWGDTMNPEDFLPRPGETPQPVPEPAPIVDELPEPQPVPRPQPPQVKPTYNRPITADHLARLKEKFKLYPRRGWF